LAGRGGGFENKKAAEGRAPLLVGEGSTNHMLIQLPWGAGGGAIFGAGGIVIICGAG